MKMVKLQPTWANHPRTKLAVIKIRLVSKRRGRAARGDALLHSAVASLEENHVRSALNELERFKQLAPDLEPEHRAILDCVCLDLKSGTMRQVAIHFILRLIGWIVTVYEHWSSKHPQNCIFLPLSISPKFQ
jgi:hypothetical protein